ASNKDGEVGTAAAAESAAGRRLAMITASKTHASRTIGSRAHPVSGSRGVAKWSRNGRAGAGWVISIRRAVGTRRAFRIVEVAIRPHFPGAAGGGTVLAELA